MFKTAKQESLNKLNFNLFQFVCENLILKILFLLSFI